jgi:predicted nucleic acid-binding protein
MAARLDRADILIHPAVIGEVALGSIRRREDVLRTMDDLPAALVASDAEVLAFVEAHRLFGLGIGWVDTHLLAAARLTPGAALWTRDRRLRSVAQRLGLAAALD